MAESKTITPEVVVDTAVAVPQVAMKTINLQFEHVTANVSAGISSNGTETFQTLKYGPGTVEVEVEVADDLIRRDAAAVESDRQRLISTEKIIEIPGVIDAGGFDVTTL